MEAMLSVLTRLAGQPRESIIATAAQDLRHGQKIKVSL